jgi:hypothetical protein
MPSMKPPCRAPAPPTMPAPNPDHVCSAGQTRMSSSRRPADWPAIPAHNEARGQRCAPGCSNHPKPALEPCQPGPDITLLPPLRYVRRRCHRRRGRYCHCARQGRRPRPHRCHHRPLRPPDRRPCEVRPAHKYPCRAHLQSRPFAGLRAAQLLACRACGTPLPPTPRMTRTDHLSPHPRTQIPSPGRRVSSSEAPERAAGRCAAAVATVARGGTHARAAVASSTTRGHGGGVRRARRHGRAGPHRGVATVFGRSAIVLHRGRPAGRGVGRDVGRWEPRAAPGRLL